MIKSADAVEGFELSNMQIELWLFFFCGFLAVNTYGQEMDSLRSSVIDSSVSAHSHDGGKKAVVLSRLTANAELKSDSMNRSLDGNHIKLNAVKAALISKIESMSEFPLSDSLSFLELNRLKAKLDSLNRSVSQALERVERPVRKFSNQIDTLEYKISKKLAVLSGGKNNLPARVDLPGDDLKGSLSIESKLTAADVDIPAMGDGSKNINSAGTDVNGLSLRELSHSISNVKEIRALQEVGKAQDKLAAINTASDQINGYREDLTDLLSGDFGKIERIPDALQSQAENLEQVKALEKASADFAAIKAKWKDPQVMKEQALNRAKEAAVNHFAGHEKESKAAMDYSRDLLNDEDVKVEAGYYVRAIDTNTVADGMETKSTNESYDPATGLVKQFSVQRGSGPVLRSYLNQRSLDPDGNRRGSV